jgi:predicted RNA-binding Zn ribbon-like protein
MAFTSEKKKTRHPFVFLGDHPAVDFANTLIISEDKLTDLLSDWSDVLGWFSQARLSTDVRLQIPAFRSKEAVKSIVELRQGWTKEMDTLIASGRVRAEFVEKINGLLAEDLYHERLNQKGKTGFHLDHSVSQLSGEKLALALVAGQIAHFLAESNMAYLHRCANTTSCVLYFYDTTKNHQRQWCSGATCGNRHKVAQFRKRRAIKHARKHSRSRGPSLSS